MAGSFAALMAEAQHQTSVANEQAKTALANRQRKEDERRRQQEEREKKERELEAKMRQRHFEEQRREKERAERRQREKESEQRKVKQREEERQNALLGRGKGPKGSSSSRRRQGGSASDNDEAGSGATALTREEKRQRRLENEFRLPGSSTKKSFGGGAGSGKGRRLPGGAVDVVSTLQSLNSTLTTGSSSSARDIRARIAAAPNALIQVNTVKRDRRTIDEHMRDKARQNGETKVLNGDDARSFNDWFGSKPKGDSTPSKSRGGSADPAPLSHSDSRASVPRSSMLSSSLSNSREVTPHPKQHPTKSSANAASNKSSLSSRQRPSNKPPKQFPPSRKRTRSPSYDSFDSEYDDPPSPPRKQRKASGGGLSAEIWSIFGKDRNTYISRDVYSDDEDMEADALEVEREEKRSARLARKEDLEAEMEEKRREEDKRRRRQGRG